MVPHLGFIVLVSYWWLFIYYVRSYGTKNKVQKVEYNTMQNTYRVKQEYRLNTISKSTIDYGATSLDERLLFW